VKNQNKTFKQNSKRQFMVTVVIQYYYWVYIERCGIARLNDYPGERNLTQIVI